MGELCGLPLLAPSRLSQQAAWSLRTTGSPRLVPPPHPHHHLLPDPAAWDSSPSAAAAAVAGSLEQLNEETGKAEPIYSRVPALYTPASTSCFSHLPREGAQPG